MHNVQIKLMFIVVYGSYLLTIICELSVCMVSGVCLVSQIFKCCDWSARFMQVILTNQIQAVNATSTKKLSPSCYYKLPL